MKAAQMACVLVLGTLALLRGQELDWDEFIDPEAAEDRVEALIEFLEWRRAHPLDINRARLEEWQQFPWIDDATAQALVAARRATGGFRRVSDLQAAVGLSAAAYRRLLPYLRCSAPGRDQSPFRCEGRHRWVLAWPREENAAPATGNAARLYQRLRFAAGPRLSGGLVCEKDPGEASATDLLRYSGQWELPWLSGRLVLGTFLLESGRGLLFPGHGQWSGALDPVAGYRPRAAAARASLSAGENGSRDGAALALEVRGVEVLLFHGRSGWDASLEGGQVRSLQWSGLHRSAAEQEARNTLQASSRGLVVQHRYGGRLRLAAAWQEARYSRILTAGTSLESRHAFAGERNWNSGLEAELRLCGVTGFAEAARSRGGGTAMEAGILLQNQRAEGLLLWHQYGACYHRLLGALDEEPRNSAGWHLALRLDLPRRVRLGAAAAVAHNLAPAWRQPMPAVPAAEYTLTLNWQPLPALSSRHRLRCKAWSLAEAAADRFGNAIKIWRERRLWSAMTQLEYRAGGVGWRTHLEYRHFHIARGGLLLPAFPDSSGWMLYQQLELPLGRRLALTVRYQFFAARCYETRFYSCENDLPGALSLPLAYGRSCRAFVLLHCELSPSLQLSAKWSWQPSEPDGSGQRIQRLPARRSVGVQLDWRILHKAAARPASSR
ncbi:MAG TPA: helix-hairpin-helix domain-containing protein [bacterium]|nr:helix-hairpin-helix domain-containing protein [bacterium]HPR88216.1 helix-hairpin-helix domain-containing protein [bacterium]